jgi:SAM-dependent methyltransferase
MEVVRSGYDRLARRYNEQRERFDNWKEVEAFSSQLPDKGKVLDAGSGTGLPVAGYLVENGFEVVGIDFSSGMVATARKNVPGATFREMDMTAIDFPPRTFDGVISCYAIIHIPRQEHGGIFRSFHEILKPGGVMLVSVASWAWEEFGNYMGESMFWSHFEPATSQALIIKAGFDIEFGRDVEAGGETHHWVLAHKG